MRLRRQLGFMTLMDEVSVDGARDEETMDSHAVHGAVRGLALRIGHTWHTPWGA